MGARAAGAGSEEPVAWAREVAEEEAAGEAAGASDWEVVAVDV